MPMIIGSSTVPLASGFRPIASMALLPRMPIPMPGPMAPRPIARPAASGVASGMCQSSTLYFLGRWPEFLGGTAPSGPLVVLGLRVPAVRRGDRQEREGEDGEDQRLNQAHAELDAEKHRRHDDRHDLEHDLYEYETGEDVPEESKR